MKGLSVGGKLIPFHPRNLQPDLTRLSRRVGIHTIGSIAFPSSLCKVKIEILVDGSPSSSHLVDIDGTTYRNGQTAILGTGNTYPITWVSEDGAAFTSWSVSGNLSLDDPSAESTDMTVNCGGTLTLNLMSCPIGEQITNGGFETGDFTGWTTVYGNTVIITTDVHSGVYACQINSQALYLGTIRQLLPNIDARCITSAGLYAKNFSASQTGHAGFYTDVGATWYEISIPANTNVWTFFDLMPAINQIKALLGVLLEFEVSKHVVSADPIRVDDVSLIC